MYAETVYARHAAQLISSIFTWNPWNATGILLDILECYLTFRILPVPFGRMTCSSSKQSKVWTQARWILCCIDWEGSILLFLPYADVYWAEGLKANMLLWLGFGNALVRIHICELGNGNARSWPDVPLVEPGFTPSSLSMPLSSSTYSSTRTCQTSAAWPSFLLTYPTRFNLAPFSCILLELKVQGLLHCESAHNVCAHNLQTCWPPSKTMSRTFLRLCLNSTPNSTCCFLCMLRPLWMLELLIADRNESAMFTPLLGRSLKRTLFATEVLMGGACVCSLPYTVRRQAWQVKDRLLLSNIDSFVSTHRLKCLQHDSQLVRLQSNNIKDAMGALASSRFSPRMTSQVRFSGELFRSVRINLG